MRIYWMQWQIQTKKEEGAQKKELKLVFLFVTPRTVAYWWNFPGARGCSNTLRFPLDPPLIGCSAQVAEGWTADRGESQSSSCGYIHRRYGYLVGRLFARSCACLNGRGPSGGLPHDRFALTLMRAERSDVKSLHFLGCCRLDHVGFLLQDAEQHELHHDVCCESKGRKSVRLKVKAQVNSLPRLLGSFVRLRLRPNMYINPSGSS
ncbi:uncharacterized protein LOC122035054 [Zingiber officinale]|uniref:uncharacterized protein LOC122035054 n=1 Tax=Zingiber officinale TaxID=94328 RepID=UPI001C4CF93B|nr:uncharacterized protein LOC122035054 [Zingiber officinale]